MIKSLQIASRDGRIRTGDPLLPKPDGREQGEPLPWLNHAACAPCPLPSCRGDSVRFGAITVGLGTGRTLVPNATAPLEKRADLVGSKPVGAHDLATRDIGFPIAGR